MSERNDADNKTMNVLLVCPEKYPEMVQIKPGLESLQQAVGGNIEITYPFDDRVAVVVNDEGKMNGLSPNRALRDEKGQIYDVVCGNMLIAGLKEDSLGSLTPKLADKFEKLFHQPEAFLRTGKGVMVVPIPDHAVKNREKAKAKAPATRKKEQNER